MTLEERLTELELRHMVQQETIDTLDRQVLEASRRAEAAEQRLQRLERTVEDLIQAFLPPPQERPPHY
jgi:uncharacterized coiled-coil protein SlyX